MPETDSSGSRGADPDNSTGNYTYTMDRKINTYMYNISISDTYISLIEFLKTF